jgi:hypothetical protein
VPNQGPGEVQGRVSAKSNAESGFDHRNLSCVVYDMYPVYLINMYLVVYQTIFNLL